PKRGRPRRLYNENRKRGQGKAHHIGKRLKRHKTNDEHLPLTEGRIKEMKVLELREELRRRNLPMSGLKEAIIERLRLYWMENEMEEGEEHDDCRKKDNNNCPAGAFVASRSGLA
uniref:SAP domain-containing protein n=1 Tax=Clytia hemisphaerica TaxID=252671 RepID=A0A7M5XLS9_9CNID